MTAMDSKALSWAIRADNSISSLTLAAHLTGRTPERSYYKVVAWLPL